MCFQSSPPLVKLPPPSVTISSSSSLSAQLLRTERSSAQWRCRSSTRSTWRRLTGPAAISAPSSPTRTVLLSCSAWRKALLLFVSDESPGNRNCELLGAANLRAYFVVFFVHLCWRWHDAGTYDAGTKTGGPNGSIRNEEEYTHGANAGLRIALDFCGELPAPSVQYALMFNFGS